MSDDHGNVTGMLLTWGQGDRAADSRLLAVVYEDLRRVARRRLRAERAGHSLAPTALVHETYLRLVDLRRVRWQNRAQFFAIAARLMRQILVEITHARMGPPSAVPPAGGCRWRTTSAQRRRGRWTCSIWMPRWAGSRRFTLGWAISWW
jgi:hypothetical protein